MVINMLGLHLHVYVQHCKVKFKEDAESYTMFRMIVTSFCCLQVEYEGPSTSGSCTWHDLERTCIGKIMLLILSFPYCISIGYTY